MPPSWPTYGPTVVATCPTPLIASTISSNQPLGSTPPYPLGGPLRPAAAALPRLAEGGCAAIVRCTGSLWTGRYMPFSFLRLKKLHETMNAFLIERNQLRRRRLAPPQAAISTPALPSRKNGGDRS